MTDKKRKRRTFWEPESPNVVAWLNAQGDLGMSLQLIIVEAMNKYGTDDVIQSHLRQLEANGQPTPPRAPADMTPQPSVPVEPQRQAPTPAPVQPQSQPPQQAAPQPLANMAPQPPQAPPSADAEYDPISVLLGDASSRMR